MSGQPVRTEPPVAGPEFEPAGDPGPAAPARALPGGRTGTAPPARDDRAKWPSEAVRARLGYGTDGGRGPLPRRVAPAGAPHGNRRARLPDTRGRTPATPATPAGVATETTEDRA
ncbi:hypothetical protein ACIQOW_04545 [Kitasatospora sp. NPDC091335]|uniref:hypothetical protein n=1 Tax=Kitasatospora sp. NPDC091335 TaxID=3364085 RepID=UPI003807CC17